MQRWEPSILVRKDIDDVNSASGNEIIVTTEDGNHELIRITAMLLISNGEHFLCGKEDGQVDVYETSTRRQIQNLYTHIKNIEVLLLAWNDCRNMVASTDLSSRFQVLRLDKPDSSHWKVGEKLLDERSHQPITQVMLSPDGSKLLLSTPQGDSFWSLHGKSLLCSLDRSSCASWKWVTQPSILRAFTSSRFDSTSLRMEMHGRTIKLWRYSVAA